MMYTAFITLVVFLTTPILAKESNVTNGIENVTLTTTITENVTNIAVTTISTMTSDTVNETDIAKTTPTTKGHSTKQKLPDDKLSPSPPPITTRRMPTTKPQQKTTPKPLSNGSASTGIIIIVVLIIIALLAGIFFCVTRNRGRRYSMDLTSRPDEAQIPLSNMEPERLETVSSNGLQFEGTENITQEAQEPEVKPTEQVEQKAEPEKATADASPDSAAPTADNSEDPPKQDVPEQTPPAPAEPSTKEKTEDEKKDDDASNKTSVESLKDADEDTENNGNSSLLPQSGAKEGDNMA